MHALHSTQLLHQSDSELEKIVALDLILPFTIIIGNSFWNPSKDLL